MSGFAKVMCRSLPWRAFAGRVVLPWSLQHATLRGDVLEVGCGSGAMAAEVLHRFPDVQLTATDYDDGMVAVATERLANLRERATVQQADALALPFSDGSFDTVLSFVMLHHVIRWEHALSEIVRVLRPGGTLIGYDLLRDGVGKIVNGREHDTRVMRAGELRQALAELPVDAVAVRPAFGGVVGRFTARKLS
jgi:ubiquinone/menaquinone biosynthesis C-methylase UbiE